MPPAGSLWTLCLLSLLVSGCMDGATSEVDLQVQEARLEEGDCTFGPRDNASDAERCHVLTVRVENRHPTNDADLSATSWAAQDDGFGSHSMPAVRGMTATTLPPGQTATVTLGFASPPDVRLVQLHHEGTFGGVATARIPSYS